MKAELLSIGDELLIGQTINTNASWLGKELSSRGVRIVQVTTISDDADIIKTSIDQAFERCDILFITGGLGPTKDDITKHTLCDYFNTTLEIHLPTLQRIEAFFLKRNRPMLDVNIRQAELPRSCEILENVNGTAAGMWFERDGKIVVSMPGVPYEMKGIMTEQVFPRLKERFDLKSLYHHTILLQGIGESFLADRISDWENKVRELGLGLAYLPSPGMVKLRLTSYEGIQREEEIFSLFKELEERMPEYVFAHGEITLAEKIGEICRSNGLHIGTVESCTGGALAASLVSVPGSSDYFSGSFLTYSNDLKVKLADVDVNTLESFGAVSKDVAEEMSKGGLDKLGVDFCISTTGIAGPDGGTDLKPVGTVWISISSRTQTISKSYSFGDNRERNIQMTVLTALNMLRCMILKINIEKK